MNPSIQVCQDHESLSSKAAGRVMTALAVKPDLLLCAAGGSTPLRTYELLAAQAKRSANDFKALRLVKLDEWGGLAMDDPGTCEQQMQSLLVVPLAIKPDRYIAFDSSAADPQAECRRIGQRLASEGPIDMCVLGLGTNGHIAMNEPATALKPLAHVAQLTPATLAHPMLKDTQFKPRFGLTLGMAEILAAREILLLVSGANKRGPLQKLMQHEITTEFPASLLWLHPSWTLFCDCESTAGLDLES